MFNVHDMNNKPDPYQDSYRSLLLMNELEEGSPASQREIAGRLGIALGLVNSYIKTLTQKGFVQVKAYPRNRFAYLLTPTGFAEKSRLAYQQVTYFHKLFSVARQDSLALFRQMQAQGVPHLSFCGVDEFTEIAYLSLRETDIQLLAVMDDARAGERFLDLSIISLAEGMATESHPVVLTSLRHGEEDRRKIAAFGASETEIFGPIFGGQL
jgi:DNA-binding MarR family transcriptional regulator